MIVPSLGIIGNVVAAVGIILVNKTVIVVHDFKFMTVLSCLHFYVTFFSCCVFLMAGVLRYKAVNNYNYVLRISMGALASTLFMNLSLAANSVGFYQLAKLSTIPCILVLETILQVRQQSLTLPMILSLLFILLGIGFHTVHDVSFNWLGFVWALLGVISSAISQIWFSPLQKKLNMNAMQLLYHTSPILTAGSFLLVPVFEDSKALINTTITFGIVRDIGFSCLLAVLLNSTNYLVLSQVSPISYQVIGHIKTILTLATGILFFDNSVPNLQSVIGITITLFGVILYTIENNKQQSERGSKLIENSSNNDNSSEQNLQDNDEDTNINLPQKNINPSDRV